MNQPEIQQLEAVVPEESKGKRLDAFLAAEFPAYSRTALRRAIDAGTIAVNGKTEKASYRIAVGQRIAGDIPKPVGDEPIAEDIPLDILFEDDAMAAINKPPGMVVHPAKGHWSGTLTSAIAFHMKNLSAVGPANRPGIVHRLDRDTSGVILIAKTDSAHRHLAAQFESRKIKKEYLAVCRGMIDRDQDIIDEPIGMHPYQREKMAIREGHSTSRDAKTQYEVQTRFRGFTYVLLRPRTGRTHQIRVHLAHVGTPVVADRLYAGHSQITLGEVEKSQNAHVLLARHALHAHRITFEHPVSSVEMTIEAPLAADIGGLLGALQTHRTL